MAISRTSRYQRNTTAVVVDRNGNRQVAIMRRVPEARRIRVMDYLWQVPDRVDTLASRYYGSQTRWWEFAEVNPHILDWTRPEPASPVMIPHAVA